MASLAVCTHHDDFLGLVAPFAIATARPTVLVVDLDADGLEFPGERTLADLVADTPTLAELAPGRYGVVSLPNGGVSPEHAAGVMSALMRGWPDVVVRSRAPIAGVPFVNVMPALPGVGPSGPCAWVRSGLASGLDEEGVHVRPPTRNAYRAVHTGSTLSGRWLRSWAAVWEWPWR